MIIMKAKPRENVYRVENVEQDGGENGCMFIRVGLNAKNNHNNNDVIRCVRSDKS